MSKAALFLFAIISLSGVIFFFLRKELHWHSPLYCIAKPGKLWAGEVGDVPLGFTPRCPPSTSYPWEVRARKARVEQYVAPGWRPQALEFAFQTSGWRKLAGEELSADLYEAFFEKSGLKLYYLAVREGQTTVYTLSTR